MGLLDDNIFESMRLILPEHRAAMKRIEREQMQQTQPALSEDQLAEMQYIIGEAIENGSQVCITLFGTYENKTIDAYLFFIIRHSVSIVCLPTILNRVTTFHT